MLVALGACALVGCSPSPEDVEKVLRHMIDTGEGGIPDKVCGFTTFGLVNPKLDNVRIDTNTSTGTATLSGPAKAGENKGKACNANFTFHYVKARSTTQGANGESVSFPVVITDEQPIGH